MSQVLFNRNTDDIIALGVIGDYRCTCSEPVEVWCDMVTDGGGWTVVLHRQKQTPQVNFNESWSTYKSGFGSADGEYYIGEFL